MSDREAQKRKAAERAVELIEDGMKLGLGTGSTARHVLEVIAEARGRGELKDIVGVVTSSATEKQARELGIPIASLNDVSALDLGIDGADEVDRFLDLTKGLGGALLWEKIVAAACERFVIVVDESKLVDRLGTRAPIPLEVVQFGWKSHLQYMHSLGGRGVRREKDGLPYITDGGNYIIDCHFDDGIEDPQHIDTLLKLRPGIVETGLFIEMANMVIVAGDQGVQVLQNE